MVLAESSVTCCIWHVPPRCAGKAHALLSILPKVWISLMSLRVPKTLLHSWHVSIWGAVSLCLQGRGFGLELSMSDGNALTYFAESRIKMCYCVRSWLLTSPAMCGCDWAVSLCRGSWLRLQWVRSWDCSVRRSNRSPPSTLRRWVQTHTAPQNQDRGTSQSFSSKKK